jgi:hypothetical protein
MTRPPRAFPAGLAAFVLGFTVLAFGWGVATMMFRVFPHAIVMEAKAAWDALGLLEDDYLMPALNRLDPAAPEQPRVTALAPGAGTETLLVTGGPWQHMATCPRFGCLAVVIDRAGTVLRGWETDPATLFPGAPGFSGDFVPENLYPVGLAPLADGGLAVTFHVRNAFPYQAGIARLGPDGRVLWSRADHAHHWFAADAAGRLYVPSMRVLPVPERFGPGLVEARCRTGQVYDEGVRVYAPDGSVLREFWLLGALAAHSPGLLYGLRDGCDPLHVNSVAVAGAEIAALLPGAAAGDLLVSIREPSAVALLDGTTGAVKRLLAGRSAAQHGALFLPDGTVAVFDNQGGDRRLGGSRVLRLDLVTGAAETLYPRREDDPPLPFASPDGGHLALSPDGARLMISSKDGSRSFEIGLATGRPLWSLETCMSIARWLELSGRKAATDRACFNAYGAYYLAPPAGG